MAAVTRVGDHLLGKGVVVAKDTPNFIGNHIALYGVACMLQALATGNYTIEEIDAITGPAIGRPGSRDLPDDGHRRRRRAGPRDAQPERAARRCRRPRRLCGARVRGPDDRARPTGREDGQGLLPAAQERPGRVRDLDAGPGDAGLPPEEGREDRIDRSRQVDGRPRRAHPDAVRQQGQGRRLPSRDAGADAGLHGAGDTGDRPQHRRCRSRDAMGVWLGPRSLRAVRYAGRAPGDGRGQRRGWPRGEGRHTAGRAVGDRRQGRPLPRGPGRPCGARPPDPAQRQGPAARGEEERGRQPGGPR